MTAILWPVRGALYRHYKGGAYEVARIGRLSEARDQIYVGYDSLGHPGETWFRPVGMFTEIVVWPDGLRRPRFEFHNVVTGDELATLIQIWTTSNYEGDSPYDYVPLSGDPGYQP